MPLYFKMIFNGVQQRFPVIILPSFSTEYVSHELVVKFTCKLMRFDSISKNFVLYKRHNLSCKGECCQSDNNDFLMCKENEPNVYSNS